MQTKREGRMKKKIIIKGVKTTKKQLKSHVNLNVSSSQVKTGGGEWETRVGSRYQCETFFFKKFYVIFFFNFNIVVHMNRTVILNVIKRE